MPRRVAGLGLSCCGSGGRGSMYAVGPWTAVVIILHSALRRLELAGLQVPCLHWLVASACRFVSTRAREQASGRAQLQSQSAAQRAEWRGQRGGSCAYWRWCQPAVRQRGAKEGRGRRAGFLPRAASGLPYVLVKCVANLHGELHGLRDEQVHRGVACHTKARLRGRRRKRARQGSCCARQVCQGTLWLLLADMAWAVAACLRKHGSCAVSSSLSVSPLRAPAQCSGPLPRHPALWPGTPGPLAHT